MACGGCRKRSVSKSNPKSPDQYDLTGGVDIKSLNSKQIQARLEVFKRKYCKNCNFRYRCDYPSYLGCKGMHPK
jgi:hypothetical protein